MKIKVLMTSILVILSLFFANTQYNNDNVSDNDFIEREEIPKEHEDNFLKIYNYHGNPLIYFNGYHEKGIIYMGDYKDIYKSYNHENMDFVVVKTNSKEIPMNSHTYMANSTTELQLTDDDNSLRITSKETIILELKRFNFIISSQLEICEELIKEDSQFFILSELGQLGQIKECFSVEQIFLIGDEYPVNEDPDISVIPHNYYIEFISNSSSYNFKYIEIDK